MLVLRDNVVSATVDAVILTKEQVAPISFVRTDGFPQSLPPGVRIGN
jgi:hypothetical protein